MSVAPAKGRAAPPRPRRGGWLIRGFRWYVRRYVRKHFHALRLSKSSAPWPVTQAPIVVVLNHPAWWDPMIVTVLSDAFPAGEHFGAIDAEAVKKYPVFQKLGFFPVDGQSVRGAAEFLRLAGQILQAPNRLVWLTAQGRFTDVRTRPLDLRTGVGHLAARLDRGLVLPIAIEYSFWSEKTPEALVRVGPALDVSDYPDLTGKGWTELIEARLTETLDALNRETISRDPELFTPLLVGRAGIGGVYDVGRRAISWARGRKFDGSHAGPQATLGTKAKGTP